MSDLLMLHEDSDPSELAHMISDHEKKGGWGGGYLNGGEMYSEEV
jgi:hypothetical protein